MFKTIRDIAFPESRAYPAFTLPAGTVVVLIKGADGIKGDLWAVRDAKVIIDLTGNTHDPIYRYTWVEAADVGEVVTIASEAERFRLLADLGERITTEAQETEPLDALEWLADAAAFVAHLRAPCSPAAPSQGVATVIRSSREDWA